MDTPQIAKLTQPPAHLVDDLEELKQQALMAADAGTPEAAKEAPAVPDPKRSEKFTFHLDWSNPHGRRYMGRFVNKILSIRERQAVGVLRAQLNGALPQEAIDPMTGELNFMVAHLTFSLVESPDWAKDLRSLTDVRVLYAVYEEVAAHEATFHGIFAGAGEGEPGK